MQARQVDLGLGLKSGFDPPDLDRPGRLPHQQGLYTRKLESYTSAKSYDELLLPARRLRLKATAGKMELREECVCTCVLREECVCVCVCVCLLKTVGRGPGSRPRRVLINVYPAAFRGADLLAGTDIYMDVPFAFCNKHFCPLRSMAKWPRGLRPCARRLRRLATPRSWTS